MMEAKPAALTGQATVRLHNGACYRGLTIYDGKFVTVAGRLRVVSLIDGESVVSYRGRARRRTFALNLVRHVLWDDDASV